MEEVSKSCSRRCDLVIELLILVLEALVLGFIGWLIIKD